jgi:predicted dithiol-disulfide oxidoreductase (DUF899 family)
MSLPDIVSHEEWRRARIELLAEEKAMTKARDALSTRRRELPMVRIEKQYRFASATDGAISLSDLFDGRSQLIVQHFMFDPEWEDGCPSCTAAADEISDGLLEHLHARDTTLAVVSRAPIDKIEGYKAKRGWSFPWVSSFGSDFNYDFHVTLDATVAPVEFNFRAADELAAHDMGWMLEGSWEQPGHSAFLRDGDEVFHTYSMYARGSEWLGGSYAFLDVTALGRQEEWERPEGRAASVRGATPDFAT